MKRGEGAASRRWGPGGLRIWSRRHSNPSAPLLRRKSAILPYITDLALLVVASTAVCAAVAWALAMQADDYLEAQHRQAVRGVVEALHEISPDVSQAEPRVIHALERASNLNELRFGFDPPDGDRELQSLLDRNGRIVGWLSWEAERPATAILGQLLPFASAIGIGLLLFAGLALWQLHRLGFLLSKSERQLDNLAHEDPVTGLPNQHRLLDRLDKGLAERESDEVLAFALIDFGGTDDIKDANGGGDEDDVLAGIAGRLRAAMPEGASVGHLRGDKFGLVIPADNAEEAIAIAERARDASSRPFWIDQVVQISPNVGIAVAPRDGTSRSDLTQRADLALRAARRRGRGLLVAFTPEMAADFDERRVIKSELSAALAARTIDVHYQPIVKPDGGTIVGVEALLRWEHASRGSISPSVFVRIAEEMGLMDQLGEFVLRRALADAARWPHLYVAVNLSPVQVRDRKFVELMASALAESGISPSRVVLEITESVLIDDPETAKSRLEELRALGVKLAIDDFGSGYSSLAYLQRLPFDKLKIDQGFVAALEHSANAGVIIQAMVALGRALGLTVVVEGVETEEQKVLMRLAGCSEMQGFLFSKPVPREEIDRMLAKPGLQIRSAG